MIAFWVGSGKVGGIHNVPMEWVFTSTNERPCVVGRQPFGQTTIANSDAAASPHTDAAILEAHLAMQDVLQRRAMPPGGMDRRPSRS